MEHSPVYIGSDNKQLQPVDPEDAAVLQKAAHIRQQLNLPEEVSVVLRCVVHAALWCSVLRCGVHAALWCSVLRCAVHAAVCCAVRATLWS